MGWSRSSLKVFPLLFQVSRSPFEDVAPALVLPLDELLHHLVHLLLNHHHQYLSSPAHLRLTLPSECFEPSASINFQHSTQYSYLFRAITAVYKLLEDQSKR